MYRTEQYLNTTFKVDSFSFAHISTFASLPTSHIPSYPIPSYLLTRSSILVILKWTGGNEGEEELWNGKAMPRCRFI